MLPELDQHAERRARRDEHRFATIGRAATIRDADTVALERGDDRCQAVDVDRDVVKPFAALREEAIEEPGADPGLGAISSIL